MKTLFKLMFTLMFCGILASSAIAQSASPDVQHDVQHGTQHDMNSSHDHNAMNMAHDHASASLVTYNELTRTAALLETARRATEKYRDVRVAESDGYRTIGPDVPGKGIHYVGSHDNAGFDVEHPAILLYEKSPSTPSGMELVGVSYLFAAAEGPDGQPADPPFPKTLAHWHRHANLCVLADRSARAHATESECAALGGSFTAETEWMVHAWIWKDSPSGVFAPTNPLVQ